MEWSSRQGKRAVEDTVAEGSARKANKLRVEYGWVPEAMWQGPLYCYPWRKPEGALKVKATQLCLTLHDPIDYTGSKITADGDCSHEIKKTLTPWKKCYDQPRQHIKKQRHYFANKDPFSQGYGFFQ